MNRNALKKTTQLSTWLIQENEHWKQTAALWVKTDHPEHNEFIFFYAYNELGKLSLI